MTLSPAIQLNFIFYLLERKRIFISFIARIVYIFMILLTKAMLLNFNIFKTASNESERKNREFTLTIATGTTLKS